MTFKETMKQPSTLMKIGLVFLILANLSHRFPRLAGDFGEGFADGVFGALMGLAIGCLLLSVHLRVRQKVSGRPPTTDS